MRLQLTCSNYDKAYEVHYNLQEWCKKYAYINWLENEKSRYECMLCGEDIDQSITYLTISVLAFTESSSVNVLSLVTSLLKNRSMIQSTVTLNFFSTVDDSIR